MREVVRALMLLRLSTLATGRTGVRPETARVYGSMPASIRRASRKPAASVLSPRIVPPSLKTSVLAAPIARAEGFEVHGESMERRA